MQLIKPLNFTYLQLGVISLGSVCTSAYLADGVSGSSLFSFLCLLLKHLNPGYPLEVQVALNKS